MGSWNMAAAEPVSQQMGIITRNGHWVQVGSGGYVPDLNSGDALFDHGRGTDYYD